jgi:DnaJ-domain-containing protein 1
MSSIQSANIVAVTQNFNQEVIERTIDSLRNRFNERGLPEDLLERLKANWYKNLGARVHQNKEEALQRLNELLENQA